MLRRIGAGGMLGLGRPVECGGQLGEAYPHGMNGIADADGQIAEAVRQIRGTSVSQVPGASTSLVTAGTGVPPSGLALGRAG